MVGWRTPPYPRTPQPPVPDSQTAHLGWQPALWPSERGVGSVASPSRGINAALLPRWLAYAVHGNSSEVTAGRRASRSGALEPSWCVCVAQKRTRANGRSSELDRSARFHSSMPNQVGLLSNSSGARAETAVIDMVAGFH